jgi:hypothetical protein
VLKNVVIAMQNPPFLSLDSNGRPIWICSCRDYPFAFNSIVALFLFYFKKEKIVTGILLKYGFLFLPLFVNMLSLFKDVQWQLFARPVNS